MSRPDDIVDNSCMNLTIFYFKVRHTSIGFNYRILSERTLVPNHSANPVIRGGNVIMAMLLVPNWVPGATDPTFFKQTQNKSVIQTPQKLYSSNQIMVVGEAGHMGLLVHGDVSYLWIL